MSVELHLPDLPEVPLSLGPPSAQVMPRPLMPWHLRLRQTLVAYLPLLLMLLLALVTWWLVKHSPQPPDAAAATPVVQDPDYTMERFTMERFDVQGRLKLRIEGREMRHFPATDRLEIDEAVIRAVAPDGRVTWAHARQAVATGDGSEVQLRGGALVTSERAGEPT